MVKKGDTLVEVALAIGIFSMVAIAVVAVMVGGTSNAQNALETTLAREEIDTQAEALRFIHAAYIADEETGENKDPFTKLWQEITKYAYDPKNKTEEVNRLIQQYSPASCDEIYNLATGTLKNNLANYAFVINPRALSALSETSGSTTTNATTDVIDQVYIRYQNSSGVFRQAATHPRLVFDQQNAVTDTLLLENQGNKIKYVEGLYVLAVKDPSSTNIISAGGKTSAYYDFYIRTCWYGTGSDSPSAISTVIRLYDPKGIAKPTTP